MQISNNYPQQYQQPSFKRVSLVRVSQKAFKNPPQEVLKCTKEFNKAFIRLVEKRPYIATYIDTIKAFLGIKMKNKFYTASENATYHIAKDELKKTSQGYSVSWFRQNGGIDIPDNIPSKKDFLSFFVYSGDEAEKIIKEANLRNIIPVLTKETKYAMEPELQKVYLTTKMAEILENVRKKITFENKVQEFEVNSLDELKELRGKL